VKSRTLFSFADDPDGPLSDTPSCGYHNALLSWLTGGLSRPAKQQSAAVWVDAPHVDNDDGVTEGDGRPLDHEMKDKDNVRMKDIEVKSVSAEEQNETLMMVSELVTRQSGIVAAKLDVTYTATAEVLSVLE